MDGVLVLVAPGSLGVYKDFVKTYSLDSAESNRGQVEFLKLTIKPLILRRTKKLVLDDLPDKSETDLLIPFEENQKKIYQSLATSWNEQIQKLVDKDGEAKSQLQMLTALLRLRQACSCPQSLPNVDYTSVPPKLELIAEKIKELLSSGESVVVFTNFIFTLEYLSDLLKGDGIEPLTLSGRDPVKARKRVLESFNADGAPSVLIMTLKTGGVGLNLTKANYVFHIEPWWNPAAENQGTDRVHRMGQKKGVSVYRYVMRHSVEEKIQKLQRKKTNAFNALFELNSEDSVDVDLSSSKVTLEDFQYLLRS